MRSKNKYSLTQELPVANYDYLLKYFSQQWMQPASYYNPVSIYGILADNAKTSKFNPNKVRIFENEVPIAQLSENKYCMFAPRSESMAQKLLNQIDDPGIELMLYAPNFIPDNDRFEVLQIRPQMIYKCEDVYNRLSIDILDNKELIVSRREREYLIKNIKECIFREVNIDDSENIRSVIDLWKNGPAGLKKNLRIQKDIETIPWALKGDTYNTRAFLGFRGSMPVSYTFLALLPGYPNIMTQIVSKALNYKSQPGGYNNTSTWEIYESCKWCYLNGIEYINSSGTSYNSTHRKFKNKFSCSDLDFEVKHWIFKSSK